MNTQTRGSANRDAGTNNGNGVIQTTSSSPLAGGRVVRNSSRPAPKRRPKRTRRKQRVGRSALPPTQQAGSPDALGTLRRITDAVAAAFDRTQIKEGRHPDYARRGIRGTILYELFIHLGKIAEAIEDIWASPLQKEDEEAWKNLPGQLAWAIVLLDTLARSLNIDLAAHLLHSLQDEHLIATMRFADCLTEQEKNRLQKLCSELVVRDQGTKPPPAIRPEAPIAGIHAAYRGIAYH